ncbi:MAG: ATP-binding protein [Candidatus Gottesmanbacteria bacterium]
MINLALGIIVWIGIICNLFLGLLVYNRSRNNSVNITFSLLAGFSAIWAIGLFFYENPFYLSSYSWLKFVYIIVILTIASFFFFSFIFPQKTTRSLLLPVFIYCLFTTPFAYIIIFTRLFLVDVVAETWGHRQILGPVYPVYGLIISFFAVWATLNFFRSYKRERGLAKAQLRYLFFGAFFFSLIPIILDVVFPVLLKNSQFIWFSPIAATFLVGFTSYAIIKHRLMDIRLVVARSVAYSLLILIIGVFYAAGFFILGNLFIGNTSTAELWISTILALIVAFTFQPLLHILEKLTDRIFYQNHYDAQLLLGKLGRIMASYISLEDLSSNLLSELFSQVKISQGSLLLIKDKHITWVKTIGYKMTPEFDEQEIDRLVNFSKNGGKLIVIEEIEEGEIKEILRHNNFNLILPLIVKQETLGLLILGEKESGDIYSLEDLQFFEILIPQMAIAIQNSLAYEEIRRFSTILQNEVKHATNDLQNANEKLKELDKLKDEFLSVASHDLTTPMIAVKSYLWMALYRSPTPLDTKVREYLDIALQSTDRLIRLVQDLLTVSRIKSKRLIFNMITLDLSSIADQIYKELKIKAYEDRIQLSISHENKPLMVNIDKTKIMEVIENLLGNALKFTPSGGKVTIHTRINGNMAEVQVSDTGPGIGEIDQEQLFQKFSRLDNFQLHGTSGTGLGLYIAKQIVILHGGKIWVKSQWGKGSTFIFSLPLVKQK